MLNHISTAGWIVILGLAVFIVVLNLTFMAGFKRKDQETTWMDKMANAGQVIKNPLKKENDQLQQLSDEVAKLKASKETTHPDEKKEL